MAEAVEKLTIDFQCRTLVMDVVREITRLDSRELSRDTSGTRAFSQFLVEMSERVPDHLQPCLSLLQVNLLTQKRYMSSFESIKLWLFGARSPRGIAASLDEHAHLLVCMI